MQDSILGLILFNLFINDVFQFFFVSCEIYLYAKDAAFILSADDDTQ